jgi:hypothetical protein
VEEIATPQDGVPFGETDDIESNSQQGGKTCQVETEPDPRVKVREPAVDWVTANQKRTKTATSSSRFEGSDAAGFPGAAGADADGAEDVETNAV